MILDTTTRKLQVVLTAAKTTLDMPVIVDYVDNTTTTFTPGTYPSNTNGVTLVDILPAPAASTQRKVNSISIYNYDTAAKVVRVYLNDNGTSYQILDLTLQIDDTLCYTDTQGWYAIDSSGNLKAVQSASATSIATAINGATNKTTPVGADELGIWDSVTGLLNKVSFTNLWAQLNGLYAALAGSASQVFSVASGTSAAHAARIDQISLYPAVASAATIDIFGAPGATINVSGTTTVTGLTAALTAQVGLIKTIIPSDAAGFSITASASLVVDGATSGTYLMPQNANIQVIATSTTMFKVTTIYAAGTWTPNQGSGLTVVGTYSGSGMWSKKGREVSVQIVQSGVTSIAVSAVGILCSNLPFTVATGYLPGGISINGNASASTQNFANTASSLLVSVGALGASGAIHSSVTYQV